MPILTLDNLADLAKSIFDNQKEVMPMFILFAPKAIEPIMAPFSNSAEKDAAIKFVKDRAKEIGATEIGFICEAWIVEVSTEQYSKDDLVKVQPSQHEDRREVIQLMCETKQGHEAGMFYILRPEHGEPRLSPLKKMDKSDEIGGRFTKLLETE